MNIFEKLAIIRNLEVFENETLEECFLRSFHLKLLPNEKICDVVIAGGLEFYVESLKLSTKEAIFNEIINISKITLNDEFLIERKNFNIFPMVSDFYTYIKRASSYGKLTKEAEMIADRIWFGGALRRVLDENCDKVFSDEPNLDIFNKTVEKIKDIYGFSDKNIDMLRYFVCQVKNKELNPSLNKAIYIHSSKKQTGKTSVARAIISILNGEKNTKNISKYESSFNTEIQLGAHDLPVVAYSNAVLLDESMPSDTSKTYGILKKMLTSRGCKFNPKFNQILNVDCRRNYIFTSNNPPKTFIKDKSERRFLAINMLKKPKQISFDEIFEMWLNFCKNCIPEKNWQEWYDSFDYEIGKETISIDEQKSNILYNDELFRDVKNGRYTDAFNITHNLNRLIPIGFFYKYLTNSQTPLNSDSKRIIRDAIVELFGEPYENTSAWSRSVILKKMEEMLNTDAFEPIENEKPF